MQNKGWMEKVGREKGLIALYSLEDRIFVGGEIVTSATWNVDRNEQETLWAPVLVVVSA